MIDWTLVAAAALGARDLHDLLALRSRVFVVEQVCAYADVDGLDLHPSTRHAFARECGTLVACARSLGAGVVADDPDLRIGRVAVRRDARRRGLARALLERLIEDIEAREPDRAIRLDAQLPAVALYAAAGFRRSGAVFLDDGIAHVTMRRPPRARARC